MLTHETAMVPSPADTTGSPPPLGVAAGASRPSYAGLPGVVDVDLVVYIGDTPVVRGTGSLMVGAFGCLEPYEDERDPDRDPDRLGYWVSIGLRRALAELSCGSSAHLRAYLRSLEWAAVDAVCPDYPWAELALRERAEWGVITFRTWLRLTPPERLTFGAMSQTGAQRVLRDRR